MSHYFQYPIICPSCGEPIACYAKQYNELLDDGYTKEDALNELGFTLPCSRIAFLQPTVKYHDTVDRQKIDGVGGKFSFAIGSSSDPNRRFRSEEIPEGINIDHVDQRGKYYEFVRPTTPGIPTHGNRPPQIFRNQEYNGLISSEICGLTYYAG